MYKIRLLKANANLTYVYKLHNTCNQKFNALYLRLVMSAKTYRILWALMLASSIGGAQPVDQYRIYGARFFYGSILVHSNDVENTSGSRPFGVELEFSKRHLDSLAWNACQCTPTTGFLLSYVNFDNTVLGHGLNLSYFIEHYFLPGRRLSPVLRGAAGLGYGTRPHHPEKNPDNQSYSLPVNVFLQLQAGINMRIAPKSFLALKAEYNHLSNGGIREPNKGINWPSVSLALSHAPGYREIPTREKQKNRALAGKRWLSRAEILMAVNTRVIEERQRFYSWGAFFTQAYRLGHLHTITAAADWHYDQSHQKRIEVAGSTASAHRVGVLAGHEFLFGSFIFGQQLGFYVFDQFKGHDPIYHRWGLSYVHKSGITVGFNLKAHRHVAEFTDIRIGFRW